MDYLGLLWKLQNRGLHFQDGAMVQFGRCIEFIETKRPDLEKQFIETFERLTNPERGETAEIGWDFAPYSFDFCLYGKDKAGNNQRWYNGGIIFHGSHDKGGDGGKPTFSVNLSPVDGWSIHT